MKIILTTSLVHMSNERCRFYGFVIMPNHIHLLLEFKNESQETFQRDFLKYTAQKFIQILEKYDRILLKCFRSTQKDRYYQIWERRPCWVKIESKEKFEEKLNYIHNNPLTEKWKLCENITDYPWSSAAFYNGDESDFYWLNELGYENERHSEYGNTDGWWLTPTMHKHSE